MASYLAPLHQTLLEDSNNRHAAAATTRKLWELSPCEGMFLGFQISFQEVFGMIWISTTEGMTIPYKVGPYNRYQ